MDNVFVSNHPLIAHKLNILRDTATEPQKFRELVREISGLLCYEVTADLLTESTQTQTPLAVASGKTLKERIGLIPILRAGLGMVSG